MRPHNLYMQNASYNSTWMKKHYKFITHASTVAAGEDGEGSSVFPSSAGFAASASAAAPDFDSVRILR